MKLKLNRVLAGMILLGDITLSSPAISTIQSIHLQSVSNEPLELVKRLQEHYNSTVTVCPDGRAAYHCSGLILRATTSNIGHFLTLSPRMLDAGAASFSYTRGDMPSFKPYANPQGYILKTNFEELQTKTHIACFYPVDAMTESKMRAKERNQCSKQDDKLATPDDYSSCYGLLGKPDPEKTLAQEWVNKFNAKYPSKTYYKQCSFSVHHAGQFAAAMVLSKADSFNEVVLTPWGDDKTPIPYSAIETVWYDIRGGALAKAKALEYVKMLAQKGVVVYPVSIDFEQKKIRLADGVFDPTKSEAQPYTK